MSDFRAQGPFSPSPPKYGSPQPPTRHRYGRLGARPNSRSSPPSGRSGGGGSGRGRGDGSPPGKRRGRTSVVLLGLAALAAAALAAVAVIYPSEKGPGTGRDVEFVVHPDESLQTLATRLHEAGLVDNARLFALYLRAMDVASAVAPGPHLLSDDLSPRELALRLARSEWAAHSRVTIPEGFNRFDIAKRLEGQKVCSLRSFLDATARHELLDELHIDGETAEGFLFPATYEFPKDSDPGEVVRRMKTEFDRRYTAIESRHEATSTELGVSLGWTLRDFIILASMVEKEAKADDERAKIASVFINRLRDPSFTPKFLQCDPTAGYGCLNAPENAPSCASYNGKITHDIVADPLNRYNTYKHEGLPPGPIANPGAKSIEAALAPEVTHYLYFVARGEGRHTFSESYAAHTSAVRSGTPR